MPIEIKEMHIKISVDEGANSGNAPTNDSLKKEDKSAIIAACVEEVMELLEKQKER